MSCAKVGGSAHPAAPAHHAQRTSAGMGDTHTHTHTHTRTHSHTQTHK